MSVADTSLVAYAEHRESGELGAQQKRILYFFYEKGGEYTRSELAETLRMRLSSVCGRVNELLAKGYLEEGPRRPCRVTGRTAFPVRLPPAQGELRLAA